jgi:hypothetical protein
MNIPTYLLGAIIFVVAQTSAGIWWASGLSSEVERLAGIQGTAIPALQTDAQACQVEIHNLKKLIADQAKIEEAIDGLDVLRFQVSQLTEELGRIREKNADIENQHGRLFELLQSQSPMQQKGNYGYD